MAHLNDLIVAAGVIGVPTLTAATIALAIHGYRRGARLDRKYAQLDLDTTLDAALDQAASKKAGV